MLQYLAVLTTMLLAAVQPQPQPTPTATPARAGGTPLSAIANRATSTLLHVYYAGGGLWRACDVSGCHKANVDWGDDSLTFALALRQAATHDSSLLPVLKDLTATAPTYPAPCASVSGCSLLSDKPAWDSVALAEEYLATGDSTALSKSQAAFNVVAGSHVYDRGACPSIPYQKAGGGDTHFKTLESQANLVKAALLLYHATQDSNYLRFAVSGYNAARTYFLDPRLSLYSVYVQDSGGTCSQLPRRFFASVNGEMIWAGAELAQDTGDTTYLDQAIQTGEAVSRTLSDARGVFADLQAENDVVEPLVEGMLSLASRDQGFARNWLIKNAAAAVSARTRDGSYGRFFDGPPPPGTVTAWQTNGGLALEIAAASIDPGGTVGSTHAWKGVKLTSRQIGSLPAAFAFRGAGIALIGTLGENCCTRGHARVLVDGRETADQTGIWQNKSSANLRIPDTIMFAWRWPKPGRHRLRFLPGIPNAKEGGSFLHLQAYELLR